jgi:hypothetical protein
MKNYSANVEYMLGAFPALRAGNRAFRFNSSTPLGGLRYFRFYPLRGRFRKYSRPIICDEWLHRPMRSFIQTHLPLFKREKVGSYFFGFVNGKKQFNVVWEYLKVRTDMDLNLWMHNIFHSDFTPYDPDEIETILKCNFATR